MNKVLTDVSRRDFLQKGILGAGSALTFSSSWASVSNSFLFNSDSEIDVIIELSAVKKTLRISEKGPTTFWTYEGVQIKGPKNTLSPIKGSYLGPSITVNKGDRVRVIFKNQLDEDSIIHWHGLDVDHANDGHPNYAVAANGQYQYDFVVANRAGMYWYHPHPHGRTGFQVYQGMAGLFIVRDAEEKALKLPSGEQEIALVFQDRSFKSSGELNYRPSMMGAFGEKLLINGMPRQKIKVKRGSYRIRLLNGCNARIVNLALSNGDKFTQIASDGGLLESPIELKRFYYAPAERFEFIIDFSKETPGSTISIESLPLVEGRGEKYSIIDFEIIPETAPVITAPPYLSEYIKINKYEANNIDNIKKFKLIGKRGVGWTINGLGYEEDNFQDYEIIKFGDTEIWEFYNPTGMPHPMHIHGTQFQVLKRISGNFKGCLDEGWKDSVLVLPGDKVQVIKRFNTFKGIFLYHCHNLEHEDRSMMRDYKVI